MAAGLPEECETFVRFYSDHGGVDVVLEVAAELFFCYNRALQTIRMDCLEEWVAHIKKEAN